MDKGHRRCVIAGVAFRLFWVYTGAHPGLQCFENLKFFLENIQILCLVAKRKPASLVRVHIAS